MREERLAILIGLFCVAMIIGVYFFENVVGVLPCEMCYWQRWPHMAVIVTGFGAAGLYAARIIDRPSVGILIWVSLAILAVSVAIGVWQAGLEWRWWHGPETCSGPRFELTSVMDLNAPVQSCEDPGWRMFGLSLAGYNVLCTGGVIVLSALLLLKAIRIPKLPIAALDKWIHE
jgi:disulfide bond formation protein DsbB